MKLKILSLVGVLSVVFIAAVIWRMNHFIQEDRTSWAQAQMRTQILSLRQTTQALIFDLQHRTAPLQEAARDKNFWLAMEPFKALAWVRDLNHPTLENTSIKEGTGLDDTNLAAAVKDLQGRLVTKGSFSLLPWKDSQNRNWLMVIWPWAENRKLVLWVGAEYLQALVETHKGALAQLAFVNESGQVLAHSQAEYFGTRSNDQYLYKEFKTSGASQGGGSFKDKSGEDFQGYFESIPSTNLVVMASASYRDLLADKNKVWASFLFIGLGLVLLTLGGVSLLKISETPPQPEAEMVRPLPPVKPVAETALMMAAKGSLNTENRHEVFKKIAGSLGHEMRAPLARILGFSQIILEKEKDQAISGYADSILREARSARGILEKLFSFAQEKEFTSVSVKAEVPLKSLLLRLQPEFQKRNIQLIQKIEDSAEIFADMNLLEKALEAVLQNSMDAMARKTKKEIHVYAQPVDFGTEIIIQDNGEGISSENLVRIFDPFFTTRSFSQHLGLGLSAAYGVIKQHGGDLRVESQKDQGAKITISLPDKNHLKEPSSAEHLASTVVSPTISERFSPADVEIEQLLDFQESDDATEVILESPYLTQSTLALEPVVLQPASQEIINSAMSIKSKEPSALDEYKVEIRRPRRAVIENS